jgi:sugar phosphate isomerase/epimerase
MLAEAQELVNQDKISVCSLLGRPPFHGIDLGADEADIGIPSLSSTKADERSEAVALTRRTIDWAVRLRSPHVILHLGAIPMKSRQQKAIRLMRDGSPDEAWIIVLEDLSERAGIRSPYLESATESLRELAAYAMSSGIRLGLENRKSYCEIPSLDEFQLLFRNVSSPALGYWHNTDHACVTASLGLGGHGMYLKKYSSRLTGLHVRNVARTNGHTSLGFDGADLQQIVPYVRKLPQIVLHVDGQAPMEDMVSSRETLYRLLGLSSAQGGVSFVRKADVPRTTRV